MIPEFKIIRKIFFNHIGKMVREDVFFFKKMHICGFHNFVELRKNTTTKHLTLKISTEIFLKSETFFASPSAWFLDLCYYT